MPMSVLSQDRTHLFYGPLFKYFLFLQSLRELLEKAEVGHPLTLEHPHPRRLQIISWRAGRTDDNS